MNYLAIFVEVVIKTAGVVVGVYVAVMSIAGITAATKKIFKKK
jgi:hypothetical protein